MSTGFIVCRCLRVVKRCPPYTCMVVGVVVVVVVGAQRAPPAPANVWQVLPLLRQAQNPRRTR